MFLTSHPHMMRNPQASKAQTCCLKTQRQGFIQWQYTNAQPNGDEANQGKTVVATGRRKDFGTC